MTTPNESLVSLVPSLKRKIDSSTSSLTPRRWGIPPGPGMGTRLATKLATPTVELQPLDIDFEIEDDEDDFEVKEPGAARVEDRPIKAGPGIHPRVIDLAEEEDEAGEQQSDTVLRDMLEPDLAEIYDNFADNANAPKLDKRTDTPSSDYSDIIDDYSVLLPALDLYDEGKLGLPATVDLIASLRPLAAACANSIGMVAERNSAIKACIIGAATDAGRLKAELKASQAVSAGLAEEKEGAWSANTARGAQLNIREAKIKTLADKTQKDVHASKRDRVSVKKEMKEVKDKQKALLSREKKVTEKETNAGARIAYVVGKEDAVKERESQVAVREAKVAERLEAVEKREAQGREEVKEKLAESAAADVVMQAEIAAAVAKRAVVANK